MSNISDGKILHYMDRILGDQKPIVADVFLTNYCNNKCPYCTYRRWELDKGARYMSYADFVTYASRLEKLGVKGIILTGGGEPTLNKNFDDICNWLNMMKYDWGINTNFNVLKLIKPNYLKVSLDGWDRESYVSSRGVDAYETVRENIVSYAEWKKENSKSTSLGIQILVKSVSEVEKFYEANKDLPVDYIVLRPMESTCGEYYKNILDLDSELHPTNIIAAVKRISSLDERVVLNYKWNLLGHQESSCVAQWAQIALNENGDVMYCCHKPYQIVGHITDEDILEKKARAITNMSMCDIPCRMTAPNKEVADFLAPKKDISFI